MGKWSWVALVLAALPAKASACSIPHPGCSKPVAPKAGKPLPLNAAAIALPLSATEVVWTDAAGLAVPVVTTLEKPRAVLVKPQGPLAPGVHTVTYKGCNAQPNMIKVSVGPVAPLPKQSGTLTGVAGAGPLTVPASGACQATATAAYAKLKLQLDPAVLPWLPVVLAQVTVDGKPWHDGVYGDVDADGTLHLWVGVLERDPLVVYTLCPTNTANADPGVAPGLHTIAVTLHLAGETSDLASATTQVTLTCPVSNGTVDAAGGADAAPAPAPAGDATAGAPGKPLPKPSEPGCGTARTSHLPVSALLFAMAGLLLWRRRA